MTTITHISEEDFKLLGEPWDYLASAQKVRVKKLVEQYKPKNPKELQEMKKILDDVEDMIYEEGKNEEEYSHILYTTHTYASIGLLTANNEIMTFLYQKRRMLRRLLGINRQKEGTL